jgi:RNA polymerase sigma factor (sigma-70 family)
MSEQDLALARAVRDGMPGAFERLMREHQGLCWHIVQRMVRHPDDTRELCQETFLRAYRHIEQYRGDSPLKAWLGRIAYSLALRHLEKQQRGVVAAGANDEDAMAQTADPVETEALHARQIAGDDLHAAIDALPPLQRTLLTLYHLDELSIPEIANITGLPDGTIKSHLFRSRRRLRQLLEEPGNTTP